MPLNVCTLFPVIIAHVINYSTVKYTFGILLKSVSKWDSQLLPSIIPSWFSEKLSNCSFIFVRYVFVRSNCFSGRIISYSLFILRTRRYLRNQNYRQYVCFSLSFLELFTEVLSCCSLLQPQFFAHANKPKTGTLNQKNKYFVIL